MEYEILLDDLLETLSQHGIDVSKLNLIEEKDLGDFISPNYVTPTIQIFENKKPVTCYEQSYRSFYFCSIISVLGKPTVEIIELFECTQKRPISTIMRSDKTITRKNL